MLCNIPLVPALEPLRQVDIIIVVDFTIKTDDSYELCCVQNYAHNNGLPFPSINTTILRNICSVHPGDPASGVPTIIYFPLVPNPTYHNGWDPIQASFTQTLNFQYSPEQIDLLSGLMYAAYQQNESTIWSVIKEYIS
jgi:hypothetical protein